MAKHGLMRSWWKELSVLMRAGGILCALNVATTIIAFWVPQLWHVVVVGLMALALVAAADLIGYNGRAQQAQSQQLFTALQHLHDGSTPIDELPIEMQEEIKIAMAELKLREGPNPKKD